jgi:hypothetical protein
VDFDVDELVADPRSACIRVCLMHGGLYEDHPDPETGRQQRCHDRGDVPIWKGYDFNEWIRLCDCCLGVALRSGSRWSPFFCSRCQPQIVAAQRSIPIGRHTMMNRFGLSDISSMFDAIDRLSNWKSSRVRHVVETAIDPPLAEFLEAPIDPPSAVRDLLEWWDSCRPRGLPT